MRKLNYNTAVDAALVPHDFVRKKQEWTRIRSGFVDILDVQVSSDFRSVTINISIIEQRTFEIFSGRRSNDETSYYDFTFDERLNIIITGYDRWWPRGDPETPALMAAAVQDHALPYFEKMHSLESMEAALRKYLPKPWRNQRKIVVLTCLKIFIILFLQNKHPNAVAGEQKTINHILLSLL